MSIGSKRLLCGGAALFDEDTDTFMGPRFVTGREAERFLSYLSKNRLEAPDLTPNGIRFWVKRFREEILETCQASDCVRITE